LLPNTSYWFFYDIFHKDLCLKTNIPLPMVSTEPWKLVFIEKNRKQRVTNGMSYAIKFRINQTLNYPKSLKFLVNNNSVPYTITMLESNPDSFEVVTELNNLKHKDILRTSLEIDKNVFETEELLTCLTHVEQCFINHSFGLHHIRVTCRTIYTQFVSCKVLLVQNDTIICELESENTFEHHFHSLKSDTIYEIRVYITDELKQSAFTYCSVKTEAYVVTSLSCKCTSRDFISFGTKFSSIQFNTNKRNIQKIHMSIRNAENEPLIVWNDLHFSIHESFCVIKETLEMDINLIIKSIGIGFPVRMFITIENLELQTFSSQLVYYFQNDRTDPKGTPHIETLYTGTNSGSVRITGYTDEKKGLFINHFHIGCFGPFSEYTNEYVFEELVEMGKRIDFHSLLPNTPYSIMCQVTSNATAKSQITESHTFITKVDPDYIILYISSNHSFPKLSIIFETLHSQRLSFSIAKGSYVYAVKRHSLIQIINTNGKPVLKLNTDDMNHYQLKIHKSTTTSLDYYGFQFGEKVSVHVCLESRVRRVL